LNRNNRIGFASGFSNPHGGRTSAAPGPGTFPLGMQAVCLGSGDSPTHGGLTPAPPVCAFVHRRSRNFTGKRPPGNQEQRVSTRRGSTNALAKGMPNPEKRARATSRAVLRVTHSERKRSIARRTRVQHQERRVSTRRGSTNALARAHPRGRGGLPTLQRRTPLLSRCHHQRGLMSRCSCGGLR